jgi:hypothetical protein
MRNNYQMSVSFLYEADKVFLKLMLIMIVLLGEYIKN